MDAKKSSEVDKTFPPRVSTGTAELLSFWPGGPCPNKTLTNIFGPELGVKHLQSDWGRSGHFGARRDTRLVNNRFAKVVGEEQRFG